MSDRKGESDAKADEKQSTFHCVKIENDGSHKVSNASHFSMEWGR